MLYESLLVFAVLIIASIPFGFLTLGFSHDLMTRLTHAYWFAVTGLYFSIFWARGQTVAMKTWHIRMETANGRPPRLGQALLRYVLACLLLPFSWLWALFAKDRQFLHDRLAGTRLVSVIPVKAGIVDQPPAPL
jgi:uncharacterized RDD family membrane protein YckC